MFLNRSCPPLCSPLQFLACYDAISVTLKKPSVNIYKAEEEIPLQTNILTVCVVLFTIPEDKVQQFYTVT